MCNICNGLSYKLLLRSQQQELYCVLSGRTSEQLWLGKSCSWQEILVLMDFSLLPTVKGQKLRYLGGI